MAEQARSGGWTPDRSAAGEHSPWLVASVISLPTFMEVLDISIANVALRHVAGSLSVSYDQATWVLTSYLVANAVVIPMSGWLADTIGRKRYYMLSVAVFVVASVLCGLAPNLGFLVIARVVQGLAGGGMQPITQAILVDTFPPSKRGSALALFGVTAILAPAIGPVLGGYITDHASWRWVFLLNIPVGILSLALVHLFITEPPLLEKERKNRWRKGISIDAWGLLFIAGGLGFLEITMDRGEREDWFSSPFIVATACLAVVLLVAFVICELVRREPLLDLRMFANRNFSLSMIIILATGVILFGTIQFLPQMLQEVMGYTATDAGQAMTLGGVATLIAMPIAGVLSDKVQARYLVGGALALEAVALWHMTHLSMNISFHDASMIRVWLAVGVPFLFLPLTNAAYVGLPANRSNQVPALLNIGRNLGGTIGISAIQSILAQRQQVHQARMVENLDPLNPEYAQQIQAIARRLMDYGASQADAMQSAMGQVYRSVLRQASMLAFLDCFWVLMIFVLAIFPLALLLKRRPADDEPRGEGGRKPAHAAGHL
jgi:DHA2 family multidrug resistance protein